MKKITLLSLLIVLLISSCDGYLNYSDVDISINLFVDQFLSETNDEYGAVASIYNYIDDCSVSDATISIRGIELEYSESTGNYYFPYGTLLSLNPGEEIEARVYHPVYGTKILEAIVPDNPDINLKIGSTPPLPSPGTGNTVGEYSISINGDKDNHYYLSLLKYSREKRIIENDEGSESRLITGNSEEIFSGESMKTRDGSIASYIVFSIRNNYTIMANDSVFSVESPGSIEITNCR